MGEIDHAGRGGSRGGWAVRRHRGALAGVLALLLVVLPFPSVLAGQPAPGPEAAGHPDSSPVEILSHDLAVELFPDRHRLLAVDRLRIRAGASGLDRLTFRLRDSLRVTRLENRSGAQPRPVTFTRSGDASAPTITIQLDAPTTRNQVLVLEWEYQGAINDPPKEPRHLRFVTPSETAGHIGTEGVYLSGETRWYPDLPGSLPTYRLTVTTPDGWDTVSHGTQTERRREMREGAPAVTAVWDVAAKTEALTLVANRFVTTRRDWNGIEVAAYLFPEDARLGEEYVEAAIRYLDVYTKLIGPYPFPKFALVENFFASGLGMPSFTLLGSGVIKRRYVQPYALGHEIVHSWFGNSVFNDPEQGNWVEGLTTYLANYYFEELTGSAEQAREQRRLMLLGYAVHVQAEEDYPVGRFTHKSDQKDNAIGYQKAAMIFHMLRREIGDEVFWNGIRLLVARRTGAYTTWGDVERLFADAAGRDLRWFFAQWVERAGAPELTVRGLGVERGGAGGAAQTFTIRAAVTQSGPPYRLRLPASVLLADGATQATVLDLHHSRETVTIPLPGRPVRLRIDPEFHTFRRLARERLAPTLNLFVTDRERVVVLPGEGAEAERAPYRELAGRIAAQDAGKAGGQAERAPAAKQVSDRDAVGPDGTVRAPGSVLVLGGPSVNQAADWAARGCGESLSVERDRFTVGGQRYEGADQALLVSCRHPDRPGHVVTLFYGLSPQAAAKVARLLFFYGWQSYLVFRDGTVVARGDLAPAEDEGEVVFDEP